jgi:tRNA nucleotidyltransferase (CCA-adding enzyme)
MTLQPRQPAGIPAGGQFAAGIRPESGIALPGPTDLMPGLIDLTPETARVLDALRDAGGRPLIVGGAVRDALISRSVAETVAPKDIDIEVYGLSRDEVRDALPGDVEEFGQSFGVFNTRINGQDFDVALPRRDNKTGEGYRGFVVETDPNLPFDEAFARRDFTMNSMGWDAENGELIDPHGGRADLEAGILRHTSYKFKEDPMRVLRGIQFVGRFGLDLAPETAALCREMAPSFHELNRSGVWGQFHKLTTKGTYISKALEALHDSGWEEHFPGLAATRGVPQDLRWHPEGQVIVHLGMAGDQAARIARRDGLDEDETSILVLAAMTHDFGKAHSTTVNQDGSITSAGHHETGVEPAREFLTGIGAPARYHEKILPLIREHMCHTPGGGVKVSDSAVRRLLRRLDSAGGGPTLKQWSQLVEADKAGRGEGARQGPNHLPDWLAIAERLGNERAVATTMLKGQHIAEAGVPRGPLWSHIVAQSEAAQDDGAFADEDGARQWLTANHDSVLKEAERRLQKAQAEAAEKKSALAVILKARQQEQKAAAKALKAARPASQTPGIPVT